MGDKNYANEGFNLFKDNYGKDIFHEYLGFSKFIQGCFISKNGYIIDTGNFQTVNYELMYRIKSKIEKHPLLWKLFFLVA